MQRIKMIARINVNILTDRNATLIQSQFIIAMKRKIDKWRFSFLKKNLSLSKWHLCQNF